jgi:hypothetical protein
MSKSRETQKDLRIIIITAEIYTTKEKDFSIKLPSLALMKDFPLINYPL